DITSVTLDAEILNLLAMVYQKLKEYEHAFGIFEKLYRLYPNNHIIAVNLSECFLKMNNKKEAKKYAMEALSIYSDFPDALKILREVDKNDE
ncbi:MAG: tetratricopeptide repeat protein, partial [Candidatus Gastranaerophilales bacterium]|nr:tetratricopeptide repeat protein [Candidatus Gastranaerophilales bacterium]